MRQQINLYQDILIDKPEPFQTRQAILLLVGIAICLALAGLVSYWQTNTLQTQADGLRQQKQLLGQRVASLEQQYPERKQNALLQEKIQRVEQKIQGQRRALDYFSRQDQESNSKILLSLERLAQHPKPGIWLRQVSLQQQGQNVRLLGSALRAEQIPEYLQLLGEENIFGGQIFAQLRLNRLKEQTTQVDFVLDSTREAQR